MEAKPIRMAQAVAIPTPGAIIPVPVEFRAVICNGAANELRLAKKDLFENVIPERSMLEKTHYLHACWKAAQNFMNMSQAVREAMQEVRNAIEVFPLHVEDD
jgi:hypothetical protein